MGKRIFLFLLLFGILAAGYFLLSTRAHRTLIPDSPGISPTVSGTENSLPLSVVAKNLEVPWSLVFLPDKSILVTERPGRVRLIDTSGNLLDTPILELPVVRRIQGEGGLHGIELHPDFAKNKYVYIYYTYENEGEESLNRVERYVLENNKLINPTVIVDKIPGALFHDGGRIKFGPDKNLYITTGDAQNPSLSQERNSLAGKILRVTDMGKPVSDNPFGNLAYSYGHRNPQGIAWDDKGRLWSTEHGPSGSPPGKDEVNKIEKGSNYGWPTIMGDQARAGLQTPNLESGSDTWAPAGAAIVNGSLFFGGLRGQALYEVVLETLQVKKHLNGQVGRIRDVVLGPDNMLYITSSNRDGRGVPGDGDDKIIRVDPKQLDLNFTSSAFFLIFTNGTPRVFTDARYHNKSQDAYLEKDNPNIIKVAKKGVTWGDFFNSLPMSLKSDCLTTGTGQTFCSNENQKLKFYINGKRDDSALGREIKNLDKLLVTYGNESDEEIKQQLQKLEDLTN